MVLTVPLSHMWPQTSMHRYNQHSYSVWKSKPACTLVIPTNLPSRTSPHFSFFVDCILMMPVTRLTLNFCFVWILQKSWSRTANARCRSRMSMRLAVLEVADLGSDRSIHKSSGHRPAVFCNEGRTVPAFVGLLVHWLFK